MKIALLSFALSGFAALALAGCSSNASTPLGATDGVAADTVGLPRARPGQIVIDTGDATVPTPYGGAGAPTSCAALAQDIARLTVLLGPDTEASPPQAATEEESEDNMIDRTGRFASSVAEDAPDLAADTARDTIVGLNPARPVVRFLGRAGEIEAAAAQERELALKRRAWLRGAFDALACEHAVMTTALRAYNVLPADTADEG